MLNEYQDIKNLEIINYEVKGKMPDAEHFATGYFKSKGYEVYFSKSISKKQFRDIFVYACINGIELTEFELVGKLIFNDRVGIPDLLLIKNEEVYFVEVKSNKDYLRENQLEWMRNNPKIKKVLFKIKEV